MNISCSATPCPLILSSKCVIYEGASLVYTNILTNDNLQIALQKIDAAIGIVSGGGITQLAPIGGSPNIYGATIVGGTLTLQPANGTFGGVLTATDWNIFNNKADLSDISAISPIFYNNTTGVISSQPADIGQSGYITFGAQNIAGDKRFFNPLQTSIATGLNHYILETIGGFARVGFGLADADGVNVGSNLFFDSYLDDGSPIGIFKAVRATGDIMFLGNLSANKLTAINIATDSSPATNFVTAILGGELKTRTAAQVRSDIGAGTGGGSVTSVAALTLGTTGTDLTSSVANSTTTPVITLNVPTASSTKRGALSSADWTTFNNKQNSYSKIVYVEDYGTTEADIQSAIDVASTGGTRGLVILEPGRVYTQTNGLIVGPFSGTSAVDIQGNGATLIRGAQSTATTTTSTNQASTTFTVNSVPSDWKIGDQLQIYDGDTYSDVNISGGDNNRISNITGNVITLQGAVGGEAGTGNPKTWAIGSTVRKYYNQITVARPYLAQAPIYRITIDNLIIDGNKSVWTGNYYWGVNYAITNSSFLNIKIQNCVFLDIPNECMEGSGVTILNNRATNLNGSFFHIGAAVNSRPFEFFYGEIAGNVTYNTNIKYIESGHSEAVITFSATSGRLNIHSNYFFNGARDVIGDFQTGVTAEDGSTRDFIFTDNYCRGFQFVFGEFDYSPTPPSGLQAGNFVVTNNVFDNCGIQDLSATGIANFEVCYIAGNHFWNGTQVTGIPTKHKIYGDLASTDIILTSLAAGTPGTDYLLAQKASDNSTTLISPTYYATSSSLSGYVTLSQSPSQTIGSTSDRLTKLWAVDATVTNAISGSVTGNAGTTTVALDNSTVGTVYPIWITGSTTGNYTHNITTRVGLNPSNGLFSATSFSGAGTGLTGITNTNLSGSAGITNANLANSAITINGVSISLGASGTITAAIPNALTVGTNLQLDSGTTFDGSVAKTISLPTTIAGLTSITSTTFVGDLTGHASLDVTIDQTSPQTIGSTGARLTKLWATDLTVSNTITGSVSGNSNTVTTILDNSTAGIVYPTWVLHVNGSQQPSTTSARLTFNPSTGEFSSTSFTGDASGLTGITNSNLSGSAAITNANLANSTITINGTSIALGGSGTITAAIPNALTVGTNLQLNSGTTFDGSAAKTISLPSTLAGLTSVTSTTFVGALTGNATTSTTATNATNTAITDDNSTNATMYPTWVTANTGNLPQKVSSTGLSYNPSTSVITIGGAISLSKAASNAIIQTTDTASTLLLQTSTTLSGPAIVGVGNTASVNGGCLAFRFGDSSASVATMNARTNGTNWSVSMYSSDFPIGNLRRYVLMNTNGYLLLKSYDNGTVVYATERLEVDGNIKAANWIGSGTGTFGGIITSTMGNSSQLFTSASATSGYQFMDIVNTGGRMAWGVENSTGGALGSGTGAYATVLGSYTNTELDLVANSIVRVVVSGSGAIKFNAYGAGALTTDSSGNITATSDERLKDKIGKFERGLSEIMQLESWIYKWNKESGLNTEDINVGLIAQHTLPIIPEAVHYANDKYTMSDKPIISTIINSIQEFVKETREEISQLKNEILQLKRND